jgi:hypothetical protein
MSSTSTRSSVRWGAGLTLSLVLVSSLPALAHEKDPASRPGLEVLASEVSASKDNQEATKSNAVADEGKRKQNLGRMFLLWFFRNHPLQ